MKICIRTGDVPEFPADVLVSTANPWLDMSGGVNGAIRAQCPEIQDELKSHLKELDIRALPAGSTVRTSAGTLPFQAILHAIAIDPFYSTSKQIINSILNELMVWTVPQGLHSISMPTLATGYGRLPMEDFAEWFGQWMQCDREPRAKRLTIVVRQDHDAEILRSHIQEAN